MADQNTARTANWTIMVYIAADDMLANFAVRSLQQLKNVAGQDPDIVVAAQFDANGRRNIARLIFDSATGSSESIQANTKEEIPNDTDMADPCALSNFIDWAYAHCRTRHYCLVLWGHGPELMIDDYPVGSNRKAPKKFLTPSDLRKALADTNMERDGHKFDIVGLDSCCMSMVELACELGDYAEFLVASQEEVPDFSFPYDRLLVFGESNHRDEIAKTCRKMPGIYIDGYRDYILTRDAKLAGITLSSLSLKDVATVTDPLTRLARALIDSVRDREKRQVVIDARANSRTFVAGLYVDLYDFCEQLRSGLSSKNIHDKELMSACREICSAILSRGENAFVISNEASQDKHCHGVSIYFPYLPGVEKTTTEAPAVPVVRGGADIMKTGGPKVIKKDGRDTRKRGGLDALNKGGLDALNKGGLDALNKNRIDVLNRLRRQRIEETEQYYPDLRFSKETGWDKFIKHCWSRWLVEEAEAGIKSSPETDLSDVLDQRYSAQQCALNLLLLCRDLEQYRQSSGTRVGEEFGMSPGKITCRATRSS